MARKRRDDKKWRSRPSRKKVCRNRNTKPCKIRKNNTKLSKPTKPSRQRKQKIDETKDAVMPVVRLDEQL
jgi:hypothetical protein